MKLVADESIDAQIVAQLRRDGHEVLYVAEMSPSISDDEILDDVVATHRCPLVTGDKDFGELVFRLKRSSHGVVLVRLSGLSPTAKALAVSHAIASHGTEMENSFSVIAPGIVRIRRDR